MTEVLLIVVALVVIAIGVGLFRQWQLRRREKHRVIYHALALVGEEVKRSRLQMHLHQSREGTDAVATLVSLSDDYPGSIIGDVERIQSLWLELDEQLRQFGEASTQTTLESSLLTNRTFKVAEEIGELVAEAQGKLSVHAADQDDATH